MGSLKTAPGTDVPSTPQQHQRCQLDASELGVPSLPTAMEGDLHPHQPLVTAHLASSAAPPKQGRLVPDNVNQEEDKPR